MKPHKQKKPDSPKKHPWLKHAFELLVAFPFRLLPLRPDMVFESHSDYCDNSKALFDHFLAKGLNRQYRMIWLVDHVADFKENLPENTIFVRKLDQSVLQRILGELQRTYLLARCRYSFFTHRNYARTKPRKSQVFFNLTHGTPLKDSTGKHSSTSKSTYILTTSPFAGQLRIRTYGDGEEQLQILGFPRNDLLFSSQGIEKSLGLNLTDYKRTLIWMPTFRRQKYKDRNDSGATKLSDIPIMKDIHDWQQLNNLLAAENILLIVKPHPAQDMRYVQALQTRYIKLVTNKQLQEKYLELYSLLACSDALLTDYSSVYLDYLILNRPIGFTIDDLEQYTSNLGFLVKDPLAYMPGEKITVFADMERFIRQVASGNDVYAAERVRISKLFNTYQDGHSCERISRLLKI